MPGSDLMVREGNRHVLIAQQLGTEPPRLPQRCRTADPIDNRLLVVEQLNGSLFGRDDGAVRSPVTEPAVDSVKHVVLRGAEAQLARPPELRQPRGTR